MSNFNHACVRILIDDKLPRSPKGAGFLIAPNLVITCAHVVAEVLKIAETTAEKPTQTLFLDFPFVEQQPLQTAIVEAWYPVKNQPRLGDIEDLALLRLAEKSCSHTAAYYWIRKYGEKSSLTIAGSKIDVVEMDEMHSYIGSKKACWLWIAVDRLEHRFLNVIVGSRDTDTGQCLWEGVAHHDMGQVMADYWKPYELFIPPDTIQT